MLVEVAEEGEAAVLQRAGAVIVLPVKAGDEVVDELGRRRVVADEDEAGRHGDPRLLPELEGLLVVAVERLEGRLEPSRQRKRVEALRLAASLLRHVLAYVLPQVAEHRHFATGDILRHGNTWKLHDAALDGVHEREVAHRPREERAFRIT